MFWSQLKKELMAHRGEALLLAGAILLWHAFLHTRIGLWDPWLVIPLGFVPISFVPMWTVWTSVQLYRQEWRENTHYLLLSLPVRAWHITLPKVAALVIGALGYTAVIAAGAFTLIYRTTGSLVEMKPLRDALPDDWLFVTAVQVGVAFLLGIVLLGLITQFAYLFSRLFERFQGLLMAWTWFLGLWMMERFTTFVAPLLRWLPDIRVRAIEINNAEVIVRPFTVEGSPFWAMLIFGILIVLLINVVIEQAVEV